MLPSFKFNISYLCPGKSNKDADHDSSHHSAKLPEDPKTVPNEEWAKRLDSEEYFCAREGGTEPVCVCHNGCSSNGRLSFLPFLALFWKICPSQGGRDLQLCMLWN